MQTEQTTTQTETTDQTFKVSMVTKLKNGHLQEALEKRGWNQNDAAEFFGMSATNFGQLINMKIVPQDFSDEFTEKMVEFTGMLPEQVFPEFLNQKRFRDIGKIREVMIELPIHALAAYNLISLPPGPDEWMRQRDRDKTLEQALATLPKKEQQVLRMRFFDDMSHGEIAKEMRFSERRSRQLEARGLRLMRHPSLSRQLVQYVTQ